MKVIRISGVELEKEMSTTLEDLFNRSEVIYELAGKIHSLQVVYVRYFDEIFPNFTPFKKNPVITQNGVNYDFKSIVALACLLQNPSLVERKRLYINNTKEFESIFTSLDYASLHEMVGRIPVQVNQSESLSK